MISDGTVFSFLESFHLLYFFVSCFLFCALRTTGYKSYIRDAFLFCTSCHPSAHDAHSPAPAWHEPFVNGFSPRRQHTNPSAAPPATGQAAQSSVGTIPDNQLAHETFPGRPPGHQPLEEHCKRSLGSQQPRNAPPSSFLSANSHYKTARLGQRKPCLHGFRRQARNLA